MNCILDFELWIVNMNSEFSKLFCGGGPNVNNILHYYTQTPLQQVQNYSNDVAYQWSSYLAPYPK